MENKTGNVEKEGNTAISFIYVLAIGMLDLYGLF